MVKVSGIFRHRGVQLKSASSWARPAILVAGKGTGEGNVFIYSISSLSFLFLFLPCPYLSSFISSTIVSLFSLSLGQYKMAQKVDVSLNPNTIDLDTRGYQVSIFLISQQKHMLRVLIRSASPRRF